MSEAPSEELQQEHQNPPAWERCKENTAPRVSGRNVAVLTASLESSQQNKDQLYNYHKSQVENLSENHPDPLQPWIEFIHYVNTFHSPNEPIPKQLLEDCVLQFYDTERYRNDVRYTTICCRYANADAEPLEMYKILFQRGIGIEVARFYCAWAWNAERLEDFSLAEQVLEKGLELKAHPIEQLSKWYQQVIRRKKSRERQRRLLLLEQEQQQQQEGRQHYDVDQRATLGRLGAESVRRNDRRPSAAPATASTTLSTFTDRTGQRQQHAGARRSNNSNQQSTSSGWEIHRDDHDDGDLLLGSTTQASNALDHFLAARRREQQRQLEEEADANGTEEVGPIGATLAPVPAAPRATLHRQAERRKENLPRVEAWNERGQGLVVASSAAAPPQASYATKPPPFQVFVDPDCAAKIEEEERQRHADLERQKQWIRGGAGATGGRSSSHATTAAGGSSRNRAAAPKQPRRWWDVENAAFDTQLLVDEAGEERCFEEARASAGHYQLLSLPDKDVESASSSFDSSADMDESADTMMDRLNLSVIENDNDPRRNRRLMNRSSASESWEDASRSARLGGGGRNNSTSLDTDASVATASVASAASATSLAGPSPTVNTKWALNQLSVMFYSPAGLSSAVRNSNNNVSRLGNVSMMIPPSRGDTLNVSVLVHGTSSSDVARLDASLDQQHEDVLSRQGDDRKPPARGGGFTIFCDDQELGTSFDQAQSTTTSIPEAPHRPWPPSDSKPAAAARAASTAASSKSRVPGAVKSGGFEIYCDNLVDDDDGDVPSAARDDSQDLLRADPRDSVPAKPSSAGFTIYCDDEEEGSTADKGAGLAAPDIRVRRTEGSSSPVRRPYDDGDTASFSEMGDLLADLPQDPTVAYAGGGQGWGNGDDDGGDTADYKDLQGLLRRQSDGGLSTDDTTGELPAFGDVSCIAPVGDHDPTSTTVRLELEHAVNYQRTHDEDLRASSRRLLGRSFGAAPDVRRSLLDQLSTRGFLRNYPTVSFPRMFKLSSKVGSMAGQELRLGNCKATVLCELGRGSYGVVSLVGDGRQPVAAAATATLALKAQTETGMLAWEYEVLERVRDRIVGGSTTALSTTTTHDMRFPMAHSMVFFADGAILGLTPALATASSSVNLIDLVNLYHAHEGLKGVPELLALHYLAQMLYTIETLHWKGKVLHCDVKPDNWLLVKSPRDPDTAADLMLIDFGRSIDLESVAPPGTSPYDVRLVGDASRTEMRCVAMRQGFTWSFDVDTYGICASAHVLLFAEHMELVRSSKGRGNGQRWMPTQLLRKNHHRLEFMELWQHVFATLLNVDDATKRAIDSRPASLRMLRSQVTEQLEMRRDELQSALRHQSSILAATAAAAATESRAGDVM